MKRNIKKIAIALMAGCFVIVACSKKDSSSTTPTVTPAPAKTSLATVSGKSYTVTNQVILPTDSAAASNYTQPTFPSGGGYVSMMGSYYAGSQVVPVIGDTVTVPIYAYIFAQSVVPSAGDTTTWGFTIASLGAAIKTGTYTFTPLSSDTTSDTNFLTTFLSGTGSSTPTLATGFYDDSQGLFNDSTATGSVTITSINTADSTIVGSYTLDVIGTKGSQPASITITNAQFNVPYQTFKTTK